VNPFNGIEREISRRQHEHLLGSAGNPFNGIESRGGRGVTTPTLKPLNPFNGIESMVLPLPYLVLLITRENPFNGIERSLVDSVQHANSLLIESIQWN